ncbi:MAG: hypothetical protein RL291_1263 [Pseudomonadota bacterium]
MRVAAVNRLPIYRSAHNQPGTDGAKAGLGVSEQSSQLAVETMGMPSNGFPTVRH